MKKLLAAILVVIAAFSMSACGPSAKSQDHHGKATLSAANVPQSLDGTWESPAQQDGSFQMTAVIQHGTITIHMSADGTSGLYWKGTAPQTAVSGTTFVSQADTQALSNSLYGSLEKRKPFTYAANVLGFKFSIMGVSRVVQLRK